MILALAYAVLATSDCAGCHAAAHDAWSRSRHATSAANPLFLASLERHQNRQRWCASCHLPAVTCTSCHLPAAGHGARVSEQTCARCHDFDVPQSPQEPMQNTYDEWRASQAAQNGKGCSSCHDHASRSGHDAAALAAALQVEVKRVKGRIVARVSAPGVGHAVPTGDPFRRLMLSAGGARKRVVAPVDVTVELDLGDGPGTTWELTVFHAELEVEAYEHAVEITKGTIE